jgi:glucose-6-phosphate dehydrogenase assembly protein OpcA
LLWTEDPSAPHPLFAPLAKLATRIIFDSESADSLLNFSKTVLKLRKETGVDTADLNWARTEGWRDLIASVMRTKFNEIKNIRITYNARETEFFCHLKVQSMYLLAWISSRLGWKFKEASKNLHFSFKEQKGEICRTQWEKLGPGTVISIDLAIGDGHLYQCSRIRSQYHHVSIQLSSPEQCELPYHFILGQTATGQSLVAEIITQGTSEHYLAMLQEIQALDKDQLC